MCSYTEFDNLAHVPKGAISSVGITAQMSTFLYKLLFEYVYFECVGTCTFIICQLNGTEMTRCSSVNSIPNPAYMTKHGDFVYVCSESIQE